jgi:hypothetical protein
MPIEGLKMEVQSSELREHLLKRAEHHAERRDFYVRQAGALHEGGVEEQQATNDPVTSLRTSAKSHGEREAFFRFMAEHIIPNERYVLSEQDLIRIEIVSRYF